MYFTSRSALGRGCGGSGRRSRRRADDGYRSAVLELHLPIGDDHVIGCQAFEDLDRARRAIADIDFGQRRFAVHDAEYETVLALRPDGLLGNDHRIGTAVERNQHANEHAGFELESLVRNARAHGYGPRALVHHRFDGIDPPPEFFAGIRIQLYRDFLIGADFGKIVFRDAEIDLDRTDILQADDIIAGLHVGTGTDLPQAENAGEGRPDHGLRHPRFGFVDMGLEARDIADLDVERGLADEFLFVEVLGAGQALRLRLQIRALGGRLRLVFGAVDRDQARAGADRLPFLEMQSDDASVDFRADDHGFLREQRTDRGNIVGYFLDLDRLRLDRQSGVAGGSGRRCRGLGRIGFLCRIGLGRVRLRGGGRGVALRAAAGDQRRGDQRRQNRYITNGRRMHNVPLKSSGRWPFAAGSTGHNMIAGDKFP